MHEKALVKITHPDYCHITDSCGCFIPEAFYQKLLHGFYAQLSGRICGDTFLFFNSESIFKKQEINNCELIIRRILSFTPPLLISSTFFHFTVEIQCYFVGIVLCAHHLTNALDEFNQKPEPNNRQL